MAGNTRGSKVDPEKALADTQEKLQEALDKLATFIVS